MWGKLSSCAAAAIDRVSQINRKSMPDRYIRPRDVSAEDTRRVLDALNAANTAEELAAAI